MPKSHLNFPITSPNKQPFSSSSLLVNILLLLSFNFPFNVGLLRTTTENRLLRTTKENVLLRLFRMMWRLVDRPPAAPLTHRVEGCLKVDIDGSLVQKPATTTTIPPKRIHPTTVPWKLILTRAWHLDQIETDDNNNNNSTKTDPSNYACLEWWWSPSRREGGGEEVVVQGLRQIHLDLGTRLEQAFGHLEVRISQPGPLALTVPIKVLPPKKSSQLTLFFILVCSTSSHYYASVFQLSSAHPVDGGRGEFETHWRFPRLSPSDSLTSCSESWTCHPLSWHGKQLELTLPPRPLRCRTRRSFFLHLSFFEIVPAATWFIVNCDWRKGKWSKSLTVWSCL